VKRPRWFIKEEGGAVSLYLIMILVPIFLFCALLIDFARIKVAEKEAESAVKTGVRSVLSAFSLPLHSYGLFGLVQEQEDSKAVFLNTLNGNLSGTIQANHFRFIDHRLEVENSSITSMYTLANHTVFKKQILEEMKYRAPMIYSLELIDKFKKTGLSTAISQAQMFSKNAVSVDKALEVRDEALDEAWEEWKSIHQKAATIYPFYQTQLADLNQLSDKVGIHNVEEVRQSLQDAKANMKNLERQIENIDDTISSLAKAAQGSADAIRGLSENRIQLNQQVDEISEKITDLQQLLDDTIRYASLLALLKIRSTSDSSFLKTAFEKFEKALTQAQKANDDLNAELRTIGSSDSGTSDYAANQAFHSIHIISREELDDYGAQAGASVALFTGLQAQLGSVWLFDSNNYNNANQAIQSFWQKANEIFMKQSPKEAQRNKNKSNNDVSKRELRQRAQPYLDQIMKAMGSCSLLEATDPFKANYVALQGDPSQGSIGYYQSYMEINRQINKAQPVPELNFKDADKANASAMGLLTSFESILTTMRDEFYVDEYAISKFNYRTLGMEKDLSGNIKQSKEASQPDSHPLANQEVEYLLYGSNSCLGNYSLAYGEMFAFRLAVGTAEALLEPHIQTMNVGSPLLVLLAAVAEGAVKAQLDMVKLVQGDAVPLAKKLGSLVTLTYKDYLRIFLLLHSRDPILLSRMQALIQLNTGMDLLQSTTYVSGTGGTSIKLWFMSGLAQVLGANRLFPCEVVDNRCQIVRTGVMAY
jgi:archaellum component FlaC